jgi:hypothetical protein
LLLLLLLSKFEATMQDDSNSTTTIGTLSRNDGNIVAIAMVSKSANGFVSFRLIFQMSLLLVGAVVYRSAPSCYIAMPLTNSMIPPYFYQSNYH